MCHTGIKGRQLPHQPHKTPSLEVVPLEGEDKLPPGATFDEIVAHQKRKPGYKPPPKDKALSWEGG